MVRLHESFGDKERVVDAPLLSDGTLRVLSIAATLFSTRENGLVIIEEIDNGVHPSRAETLVSQILHIASTRNLHVDDDGIVCIPPVRGEAAAADRLLDLLVAAYGPEWTNATLATLLANADHAGKTLETWLREKFFAQHCKLFQHRPFIWHIWDGLRDGFSALVNYHKLDYKNLETLTYTYVGDWISRQKQDLQNGLDGAGERLAAVESLKKKLELILAGEAPHGRRRTLVWAELGEAPLARALEHLADVAEKMSTSLAAGTVHDLLTGYMGAGNVAIDVARTAIRYGAESVDLYCLESRDIMYVLPYNAKRQQVCLRVIRQNVHG